MRVFVGVGTEDKYIYDGFVNETIRKISEYSGVKIHFYRMDRTLSKEEINDMNEFISNNWG